MTAEEIAAKLTPATKQNLASGHLLSLGTMLDLALTDSRLLDTDNGCLTPLGQQVRSILEGQQR